MINKKMILSAISLFAITSQVIASVGVSVHIMDSKITFNDIVGLSQAKQELGWIPRFFESTEKFERVGISNKAFYILSGKSRSGRSYITQALCGEIHKMLKQHNRPLDEIKLIHVEHLQMVSAGIPALIQEIKAHAPCILYIDDARVTPNTTHGVFFDRVIEAVHACDQAVFVLASTCEPLDKTFPRGKFVTVIDFEYPNFDDRKECIAKTLDKLFLQDPALSSGDYDINKLAMISDGASYEQLIYFVKGAFQTSKIHKRAFTQELLEEIFVLERKIFAVIKPKKE